MSPPNGKPAALLVDADNVTADCVEFALTELERQGWRVSMRRAYGGHQKLADMRDCLLRHAVRPFVNHGVGTTDALLVIDAMDLLYAGRLPPVVAIASSDADFAPLAVRLREAGMRVICFAHSGKSADGALSRCYDELQYVDGARALAPPAQPAPAAKKKARTAPARKVPAASVSAPAERLRQVLEALPGFKDGEELALNVVVRKLKDEQLLGEKATGPEFLRKHAGYVELVPAAKPNKVRLKRGA